MLNDSKSKLLYYKGRSFNVMHSGIIINRVMVHLSEKAVHLGHTITSNDRECITLTAKSN